MAKQLTIPGSIIAEIKSRVDIVGLVQEQLPLKKAGAGEYKACCPFHNEKTPSFTVSAKKGFYHCFGCGAQGDQIDWVTNYLGVPWGEAVARLAESVGIPLPENEDGDRIKAKAVVSTTLLKAAQWMHRHLMSTPRARAYVFETRKVSPESAEKFLVGHASRVVQDYHEWFSREEMEVLVQAGVIGKGDGGRMYPKLGGRIIFPIRDAAGWVIGFSGRVIIDAQPKYMNSPDSPFFSKRKEIFRAPDVRRAARAANRIVVTEGYFDVLSLFEAGFGHAVAGMGTATTPENLESMFSLAPEVVFCFDGDTAGRAAAWKALLASLPVIGDNKLASFAFIPGGLDPDEFVRANGAAPFAQLLDDAVPLSRLFIDTYRARKEAAPLEKHSAILTEAAKGLRDVKDNVLRQGLAVSLGNVFDVPVAAVQRAGGFGQPVRQLAAKSSVPSVRADALETSFLANLLRRPWEVVYLAPDVELKVPGGTEIVALLRKAGITANQGHPDQDIREIQAIQNIRATVLSLFSGEPYLPLVERLLAADDMDEPLSVLGKRIEAAWLDRCVRAVMSAPSVDRGLVGGLLARKAALMRVAEAVPIS